jgi:hypothetical protein
MAVESHRPVIFCADLDRSDKQCCISIMQSLSTEHIPGSSPPSVRSRRACLECHRQKQRCNRQQPCSNCVRRGIPHDCIWPTSSKRHHGARLSNPLQRPPSLRVQNIAPAQAPQTHEQRSTVDLSPVAAHSQAPRPGQLYRVRDAPSYHGNSYFGHHSAAALIGDPSSDLSDGIHVGYSHRTRLGGSTQPFRSERGPYASFGSSSAACHDERLLLISSYDFSLTS